MINPHDPFGQLSKKQGQQEADSEKQSEQSEGAPAEEPKQKRKYVRRAPPLTKPQIPVEKPEAQEPELVAAIFTTGELTIYVGEETIHLTAKQREKLERFLGITAPRMEATRKKDCDK